LPTYGAIGIRIDFGSKRLEILNSFYRKNFLKTYRDACPDLSLSSISTTLRDDLILPVGPFETGKVKPDSVGLLGAGLSLRSFKKIFPYSCVQVSDGDYVQHVMHGGADTGAVP
jgi:hypothetical protein